MDAQLFGFLSRQLDEIDKKLDDAKAAFEKHADEDLKYWRMLDEQRTELSLVKRLLWGAISVGSTVGGWFTLKH